MPYKVEERDGKYRVILADTGNIAMNAAGTSVDGGGHDTKEDAEAQARAIEAHENKSDDGEGDVIKLLDKRCRTPGLLWKHGNGVFLDTVAEAPIQRKDPSAMSATFCISTPRPDREEDVIIPEGVDFSDYRFNPVVMWDHGLTNLTLPIGKSIDPIDTTLAVTVLPGVAIEATCYFSQTLPEAEQIFHLVTEDILRGASIHVDPIDAIVRSPGVERPGLLVKTSKMIEWSITTLGCNPDAVKKILSDGRLCGRPLHEGLVKSLSRQAAPSQVLVRGVTLSKADSPTATKTMADKNDLDKKRKSLEDGDEMKRLRKEYDDAKGDDEEAKSKRKTIGGKIKSLYKADGMSEEDANIPDEPGETKSDDDEPRDDDADRPHGSKVLGALHSALSDVTKGLEEAKRPLDNKEVKEYVEGIANSLNGMCGEIKDFHGEQYPNGPDLEKDAADGDRENVNNEPPEASGMVKFLARNNTNRLGVKGASKSLDRLCARKDLPKGIKQELQGIAKTLAKISDEALAKSRIVQHEDADAEFVKLRAELKAGIAEVKKMVTDAAPANRR